MDCFVLVGFFWQYLFGVLEIIVRNRHNNSETLTVNQSAADNQ